MNEKTSERIPLKILHLEDTPQDAELIRELLIDAGFDMSIDCVATEKKFTSLLRSRKYDLILADFKLPGFDGFGALRRANEICPDVPFICISGTIGEEAAVELIRQGAVDYVIKDRLKRLSSSIKRALEETKEKTIRRLTEEALRESEERFRIIASNTPDHIFIQDLDLRYQFVINPQLGLTEKDMIGKTDRDFLGKEEAEKITAIKKKVLDSGDPFFVETSLRNLKGDLEYFDGSYIPKRDSTGKISGLIGYFRNITKRKQTENALHENEEIFRHFMENSPIYIFFKDEKIHSLRLSKNYESMLGKPITELLGKNMNDLFPSELAKSMVADDMRILAEGKAITIEEELNGRFYSTIKFPIFIDGKPRYLAGYTIDITEQKQYEEALKKSEVFLDSIFECSPHAMWVSDSRGTLIRMNQACCDLLQITFEEVVGKYNIFKDSIVEDQGYIPLVKKVFERGEIVQFTLLYNSDRLKDFELNKHVSLILDVTISPVLDQDGNVIHAIIQHVDITERQRAQEALQKSEERYRRIFENVQDVYYETLLDGTIIEISPSIELVSKGQYHRDDLLGKSIYGFYLDVKDRDTLITTIKKTGSVADYEVRFKNRDDSIIHCSISAKLSFEAEGKIDKIIGSMHDITDRKQTEAVILKERTLLRTLIDNIPSGIFVKDNDYRKIIANPTHLSEVRGHLKYLKLNSNIDILGKTDFEVFPKELAEKYSIDDQKIIKDGNSIINNVEFSVQADGKKISILVSKVPLRDIDGSIIGMIGITNDITEQKSAEEQIQKNLREKEILLRELYHRTKNNMQVICSLLRLQTRKLEDNKTKNIFREIETKIYSMALVHQKLMGTKDLSHLKLNEYLESLIIHLKYSYTDFKEDISLHADLADVTVLIDTAIPLGLVFNELISNVIKHAFPDRAGGKIDVRLYQDSQKHIILEVSDNGIGFPKDFDIKKDADFGLETVIDLVEQQLGGAINFRSRNGLHCQIVLKRELYNPRI